jgi:predicted AlkP superfamily phosphohydrolase/phosphomutase
MGYEKVCVLGLDCAEPSLVFERYREELPFLARLMARGCYGPLESTVPPITVPAWMCMMTGCDPGTLGIYGFRNRRDRSYGALEFANSHMVCVPTLWELLGEQGKESLIVGVPLTYPPKPLKGALVSDFLAPSTQEEYTYPPELRQEIAQVVGDYLLDARGFREKDRDALLAEIYTMTERRFTLAKHLLTTRPWNLFVMVEMGPDRMHHAFWRYMDAHHPFHQPEHRFANAIRDYYRFLDAQIEALVQLLDENTLLLVVSDHGAKRMVGGFCFNEWLMQEGYLVLKTVPETPTKFSPEMVDWSRTRAWGDGGYYGRLFLNVRGREPQGTVPPEEVEALKQELIQRIEALSDENGQLMGNRVFRSEEVYTSCRGVPPDLIVYFGDLHWRSVGSVGHNTLWTHTNDTGPDDANHAPFGIFLMGDVKALRDTEAPAKAPDATDALNGLSLYDIAPTVLNAFDLPVPANMRGKIIERSQERGPAPNLRQTLSPSAPLQEERAYTEQEEEELARRLEELGYI